MFWPTVGTLFLSVWYQFEHAPHARNQRCYFDLTKIRVGWPHTTKNKMPRQMAGYSNMLHWGRQREEIMETNVLRHHKHQLNSAEIDGLPSEEHKQKIR